MLVMLVVASQWTSLHARSVPQSGFRPLNRDDQQDTQSYAAGQDSTWDAESFTYEEVVVSTPPTHQSRYNYEGDTFASTEAELPFDSFIDSPEIFQGNSASFANHEYTQAEYANDEVFFDTSDAAHVYRANDE